ncbi:MAG: hypothetical protein ABR576_15010, partial [Thermoanaerobaculia bacterium]
MRAPTGKSAAAAFGALLCLAAATVLAQAPTPTPRSKPRLSGGFGRPRPVTPTPFVEASRPPGAPVTAGVGADKRARAGEKSAISITNETLVTDPSKGKLTTTTRSPAPPQPGSAAASPSRTAASEVPFDD